MNAQDFSTLAYNIVGIAVGISAGAGAVVRYVVKPYQEKLIHATTLIDQMTVEVTSLRTARVVEQLQDHSLAIAELRKDRVERVAARFQEHAKIESSVRHMIEQSDIEARNGRKHLHEDIGSCRNEITRLGANFANLEGWLKTVDERLDQKTTELIAAVANAAGRNGN